MESKIQTGYQTCVHIAQHQQRWDLVLDVLTLTLAFIFLSPCGLHCVQFCTKDGFPSIT